MRELVHERAVVGEHQEALGVAVEAPRRDDALAHAAQEVVDGLPPSLLLRAQHAAGLVEQDCPRARPGAAGRRRDAAAVDLDDRRGGVLDAEAGLAHDPAVDADGAARDDRRAVAARVDAEPGENALETFGHGRFGFGSFNNGAKRADGDRA